MNNKNGILLRNNSKIPLDKGWNVIDYPINQIVGYIISGDLGYISSYKEARNRMAKIDRTVLVEELLKNYLK